MARGRNPNPAPGNNPNMIPLGGAQQQIDYLNTLVTQSSNPPTSAPQTNRQPEPTPAALLPNATPAQIAHQERIQRTVYCGNLAQGVITNELLEEFFNQSLSHLVADPIATPPVKQVKIEGAAGRFAFVEFLSEDIVKQALRMDQMVEIHGKVLTVGRPKGYVEGFDSSKAKAALAATREMEDGPASLLPMSPNPVLSEPSEYVLLSNILPVGELRDTAARDGLKRAVTDEASKHGTVVEVSVPSPPKAWADSLPGRVYIKYASVEDASKAKKIFDTRTLNGNRIYARGVTHDEFARARKGAWVDRKKIHHGKVDLPGLYPAAGTLYAGGVSGLLVLSPALGAQIRKDLHAWEIIRSEIIEEEVPLEKGWVKLRGFSEAVTKAELANFLKDADAELTELDVNVVRAADDVHLGEAFVRLNGKLARTRLGLAKDRCELVTRGNNERLDVFSAHEGDLERRLMSGCVLAYSSGKKDHS